MFLCWGQTNWGWNNARNRVWRAFCDPYSSYIRCGTPPARPQWSNVLPIVSVVGPNYRVRMKMFPNAKEHRTPVDCSAGSWHLPGRMEDHVKFSSRRSPVARAVRVLEFYVPSFGAAMLSGAPSADDACCSATPRHGSGLSSGAPVAAATSAGVMRAHFGARVVL